jgi:PCI domain
LHATAILAIALKAGGGHQGLTYFVSHYVMPATAQDDFMENARLLVFETYCRIHQCIDLQMLADKLGMDKQAAETWVVNLIRNARLNAKIDSKVFLLLAVAAHLPTVHLELHSCRQPLHDNATV